MSGMATTWARGLLCVGLATLVASCDEPGLTAPTSTAQLDGTWRLQQMTSNGVVHTETLTAGRFSVTFASGRINAVADCNRCTGGATLAGSTLSLTALACTRAACASAPLDTRFTSLLDGTLMVRVGSGSLQLNGPAGELRFER